MAKHYRQYSPDQEFLLPPSVKDWLPEGHLAYFVSDLVDGLDLSEIERYYDRELRGYPPYHPRMMVKILAYAYCVGVLSSRRIARHLQEDVAFRVLAAENFPDFRTISDFRKIHLRALSGLFEQVLVVAKAAGAVKVGRVVVDGTKVKANASKHKAMSYKRMQEKEEELKQEVEDLLKQAEEVDAEEDDRYGRDRSGDELPEELSRRESRLKRIREAKKVLEERARAKAAEEGTSVKEAKPKEKAQYNFTDPESRIMKGNDGFIQGYNAQVAVDSKSQMIVGQAVTQESNDKQQIVPMVEKVEQQAGQRPTEIVADSGYCSEANLEHLASENNPSNRVHAYIATGREDHDANTPVRARGALPKNATRIDRMKRKLKTVGGAAIYATRKGIVEPVFGQIRRCRGFRQFLMKGIEKVRGEWSLICLTHNILKLYRFCEG